MRFLLLFLLSLLAIGCNSDPRCRRETALLRSEILDLEDKYYILKSENDSLKTGQGVTGETYLSEQPQQFQQLQQPQGESYYTDTGQPYYPIVDSGQTYYNDGEISYDNTDGYQGQTLNEQYVDANTAEMTPSSNLRLPPDDSIIPLQTGQTAGQTAGQYDNMLDTPSVVQEYESDQGNNSQNEIATEQTTDLPNLTELDRSTDMNIMLNAPDVTSSNLEIGYDQAKSAKKITEVIVNRSASAGTNLDGISGDEGLDLLVQTRTANGQAELVAGELTVSVIDPAQSADRQRIGLWKFTPDETRLFFANSEIGSYGILLHLPWDQQTPVNSKLIVHVRFVTPDGRDLATSSEIRITPPRSDYSPTSPTVTGWTKRDSRWIPGSVTRMTSPKPRPQYRSPSSNTNWQKGSVSSRSRTTTPQIRDNTPSVRNSVPAVQVKAQIEKPTWRPTR